MRLPFSLFAVVFLLLAAGSTDTLFAQKSGKNVTEVFRLSRVGRPNVAETRELLVPLYNLAAKEYDAQVERERAEMKKVYRGHQVRILRVLGESDANGQLYLCAYGGAPTVFSIAGDKRSEGELTPALKVEEAGTHETSVTRTVLAKAKSPTEKPKLETVDDSDGGAVTFFGIPLVFDDGPSKRRSNPAPASKRKTKSVGEEKKEITETKSFPKYSATVSTELLEEGPPKMSTALFLDLVKNGKVFTVKRSEKRRCQQCRGFGRVTDTVRKIGSRDPDGKMPCPECASVGSREWDVTYFMTW